MIQKNFFIVTGPPGSGKTTLLRHLEAQGYPVVPEPAREVLAEQRRAGGDGLPEKNPRRFLELMLARMTAEYQRPGKRGPVVLFDRGIPDVPGYAAHFGLDFPEAEDAAWNCRYRRPVFFAPAWEEIYATDDERTLSFDLAREFGEDLRAAYDRLGYSLVELPRASVEARAEFLREYLGQRPQESPR